MQSGDSKANSLRAPYSLPFAVAEEPLIGGDGKFVATIVFDVAAVTGNARIKELMTGNQFIEFAPKILVLDSRPALSFAATPPIGLPFGHPFAQDLADINAVGQQFDVGRPVQRLQAADDRGKLHAVVRRLGLAARLFQILAGAGMPENEGPAPRARIPAAGPVCKQLHFGQRNAVGIAHGALGTWTSTPSGRIASGLRLPA